jgi:hypothetical protein
MTHTHVHIHTYIHAHTTGTGKTFLGNALARFFLSNKLVGGANGPLLIVAYTNHALDQVVEHLLKENPGVQLARLGGGSKSDAIQAYTFSNLWGNCSKATKGIYDSEKKEVRGMLSVIQADDAPAARRLHIFRPAWKDDLKCLLKKQWPELYAAMQEAHDALTHATKMGFISPPTQNTDVISWFLKPLPRNMLANLTSRLHADGTPGQHWSAQEGNGNGNGQANINNGKANINNGKAQRRAKDRYQDDNDAHEAYMENDDIQRLICTIKEDVVAHEDLILEADNSLGDVYIDGMLWEDDDSYHAGASIVVFAKSSRTGRVKWEAVEVMSLIRAEILEADSRQEERKQLETLRKVEKYMFMPAKPVTVQGVFSVENLRHVDVWTLDIGSRRRLFDVVKCEFWLEQEREHVDLMKTAEEARMHVPNLMRMYMHNARTICIE